MRTTLLKLTACAAAALAVVATASASAAPKLSPYRAAALKCADRHSLEAKLTGTSIGFLSSRYVPCVLDALRGKKITSSAALRAAVTHDARAFYGAPVADANHTYVNDLFTLSADQVCSSPRGDAAWLLGDNTAPPALTYIVLAKQIDETFFVAAPHLGTSADAQFAFAYTHRVFFHDGKPTNPLGIAAVVLNCP